VRKLETTRLKGVQSSVANEQKMTEIHNRFAKLGSPFNLVEVDIPRIEAGRDNITVAGLFPPGKADKNRPMDNPTSKSFLNLLKKNQLSTNKPQLVWVDLFFVSSESGSNDSVLQGDMLDGAVDPKDSSIRDSQYARMFASLAFEDSKTGLAPVYLVAGSIANAVHNIWENEDLLALQPVAPHVALVSVNIGHKIYKFLAIHDRKHLTAHKMAHGAPTVGS
jgi:hypothetical protein